MGARSVPAPRAEELAAVAGRYRIETVLGRGGMGAVYAAFDPVAQRRVALKLLALGSTQGVVELFEREYQTLTSLRHAKIVDVFEYGHAPEGFFYTMELLEGGDLSTSAPMAWREVCACLREVATVLGLLHVRGLVHRDLSPRNVWRTPEGKLKLIDFGALAAFGPATNLVGTPPFVPPEAVRGLPLDPRSDLYALGALGYWLLTGVHAYPAKSMGELRALWGKEPPRPSTLLALVADRSHEVPPRALEELLFELLRLDPDKRIRSTAELIDRATSIADLPPDASEQSAQGYLQSKAFVGRTRERERLASSVSSVEQGAPQSLFIEAASGVGRTRLLSEMAVLTRLTGALTLSFQGRGMQAPYALASALLSRLCSTLPEARNTALARAEVLAPICPELRADGEPRGLDALRESSRARIALQSALQDWLLALTRERVIALFVDDLQQVDEESLALLNLVARAENGHKLLIVTSILREGSNELSPLAQSLRSVSSNLRLLPFTSGETLELLHSVFGDVPYLQRLAERFYRLSGGNPSHCFDLCEHLVRVGAAHYMDGLWVLPTDLATAGLPKTRNEGILARLDNLTDEARALAENLSIPHPGTLPHSFCLKRAGPDHGSAQSLLESLVKAGVLVMAAGGYEFAHEVLRETLFARLAPERRRSAHRMMAETILGLPECDRSMRLTAGLHYIHAEDLALGEALQVPALIELLDVSELSGLSRELPLVEQSYLLLKAAGRNAYALAAHLTVLAVSAYQVDRRMGERYGEQALSALGSILSLALAPKLQRFVGKKLALGLCLLLAWMGMKLRGPRWLTIPVAIRFIFFSASSLAATATISMDGKTAKRYADAVAPLAALGANHVGGFNCEYLQYLALRCTDRPAAAVAFGRRLLQRLLSNEPIRGLPDGVRKTYIAGLLFSQGVSATWRDDPEALTLADQVQSMSPFHSMCADHLRAGYYGGQGQTEPAAYHRRLVDRQAIQLGSAWQLESWLPADLLKTAMLTHDALALKRAAQELERLSEELPSFRYHLRSAQATYLLLRGKPREAAELLKDPGEPLSNTSWSRSRGSLACARNALGEHAEAQAICEDALRRLTPEDLQYAAMYVGLEVQLALACAGSGQVELAKQQLDRLLARHGPNKGPLTLGAAHDAYVAVALKEGNFALAAEHFAKMDSWYAPLAIPSLSARLDVVQRQIRDAQQSDQEPSESLLSSDDVHLITRVQLLLTSTGELGVERANKALQIAVELSSADDGFIVFQGGNEVAAHLNEMPATELMNWARARLLAAYANDETAVVEDVNTLIDLNLKVVNGVRYCVAPLWARANNQDIVVAAVALGFRNGAPQLPPADVLRVIAGALVDPARNSEPHPE